MTRSHHVRLLACAGLTLGIWMSPAPEGLSLPAWHTFAVFVGVIAGFLLRPIDMAPMVLLGLTTLLLTSTVDIAPSFQAGFGSKTVWLVVMAFLIAGAVERTGLGRRIALYLIRALGKSMLGLGYGIAATELVLGPFIPSNTARGGGIVSPVTQGLARILGSDPQAASVKTGAYLVQVGSHSNLVVSAMFLTAMAGNLLLVDVARDTFDVNWDFATWLQGSIVPGIAGLCAVPWILYKLSPPESQDIRSARESVAREFEELGSWSRGELTLACILCGLLVFWSFSRSLGVHSTTVAMCGLLIIVLTGTLSWKEIVGNIAAWDSLIWLGGFVALADALKSTGFTEWFRDVLAAQVSTGSAIPTMLILALIYFFSMFFFSQLTAHISALAGIFLALAKGTGAPALFSLAVFSYFSCLCGALTPWSSGPVIIYFGFGYVSVGRWIRNGVIVAIAQIVIWLGVGMPWWAYLGWW